MTQNTHNLLDDCFIPEWIKQMGDTRSLKEVMDGCEHGLHKVKRGIVLNVPPFKETQEYISDINLLHAKYKKKAKECAQILCMCQKKSEMIEQFMTSQKKTIMYYLRCISRSKDEMDHSLKALLQLSDKDTGKTALENAVEKGWYDIAEILISYGANPTQQNIITGKTIIDLLANTIQSPQKQNTSALDNFLHNVIKSIRFNSNDNEMTHLLDTIVAEQDNFPKSTAILKDRNIDVQIKRTTL